MKLNYIKRSVIPALVAVLSLSSCLKENNPNLDFNSVSGKAYVGFADPTPSSSTYNSTSVAVKSDLATVTVPLTLTYFSNNANPGTTVTIKIETNKAIIDAYNTSRSTNYKQLSPANYSLTNTQVTIPAGSKSITVPVVLKPNTISDVTALYALPVMVSSASNVEVSGNYGVQMILVSIKNPYDAIYKRVGNIQRNSATGPDPLLSGDYVNPADVSLVTDGPVSNFLLTPVWKDGSGIAGIGTAGVDGIKLTVNPATNRVTVSAAFNPAVSNSPGSDNYYDPATKTFHLAYQWGGAPNTRVVKETLTYLKERP